MIASLVLALITTLPFTQNEHVTVLENVYLNETGPFRMVVDTGAQSTIVVPVVANRAGMRPRFRVEHVTASGTRIVPGGYASVRAGSSQEREVEIIISELPAIASLIAIDGVLGQSWLQRFNYSVDYTTGAFTIGGSAPPGGRIPFVRVEGRITIPVNIDGRLRALVIDSGTPQIVLFGGSPAGNRVLVKTNNGSREATQYSVRVGLPGVASTRAIATRVGGSHSEAGLLPLTMFSSIYVDNRESYVILRGR